MNTLFFRRAFLASVFIALLAGVAFHQPLAAGDACCPEPSSETGKLDSHALAAPVKPDTHSHDSAKSPETLGHDHDDDHEPPALAEPTAQEPVPSDPHAGHNHDKGHEGHGHGNIHDAETDEGPPGPDFGLNPCEHKIPIIDCDECRYEIGVVKVGSGAISLLSFEHLHSDSSPDAIDLNGELAFDENRVRCITSPLPGRVTSLSLRVGDSVRDGQTLLTLQSSELAQSALEVLKKSSELDLATKKLEREKILRSKKIASEQEKQEAEAAWDLARIELDNARRRLLIFGIPERRLQSLEKKTTDPIFRGELSIQSPITGRVLLRDANVGDMISSDKELLKIVDLTHIQGIGQAHEKQLGPLFEALKKGPVKAEVSVDAFPGRRFDASVVSTALQVSVETRTLPLRLEVENHDETLRPGLFFKARIFLAEAHNLVTVARNAVLEDGGKHFAFIRLRDNYFLRRTVVPGPANGDRIAIVSGLQATDEIVSSGSFLLKSDVLREKMGAGCAD